MRNKLLYMVLLCMVLLIGVASAELQFDNIKQYNAVTKEITVVNTFGLGADIAKIKLNTPLVNVVPMGYQKVAEIEITNYEDYTNALNSVEFYNVNDKLKPVDKQFDYKVWADKPITVNDYDKVCTVDSKNFTEFCTDKIIGEHIEYIKDWLPLEKLDFVKGEVYKVGIFTQVNYKDNIEWIPTYY